MTDNAAVVLAAVAVLWLLIALWLAASTRRADAVRSGLPRRVAKPYGAPIENRRKQPATARRVGNHNVPRLLNRDDSWSKSASRASRSWF